jgi:hypothetical protein
MKWYEGKDDPISWFFQNLEKPYFLQAEVLVLAGKRMDATTLQNWTNRKYVTPRIIGGKRRYNVLDVAQISLSQPMIWNLGVPPSAATLMVVTAMVILQRKLKSEEFSPKDVSHMLALVYHEAEDPIFIDARKAAPKLLEIKEGIEGFIVLSFGRLLIDLAKRQKELVERQPKMRKGA